MITPQSRFLLQMFEHYRHRLLPGEGGVLQQPHYYAEAMEILSRRNALIEAELLQKRRADLERGSRLH